MSDLISRQDAIDALTRKMVSIPTANKKDLMGDVNRIRTEDISVIKRLPSAERKGKWIRNMDSLIGAIQKPYCSVCGNSAIGNHGFDYIITNFCPNCGADMRGDKDGL